VRGIGTTTVLFPVLTLPPMASATDGSVPRWWIVLFLLLVVVVGASVILYAGGSVLP